MSGARLKSPRSPAIRPTTGLVRGAMFSILQSLVGDWSRVLDLYAGTGALGIEALSRGATWVDFVEHNPRNCAVIKGNLEQTGFASQAHIYRCSVSKALSILKEGYDVIFLDPPYSDSSLINTLKELFSSRLAGPDSTIVVQHSSHQALPVALKQFHLVKNRRHGDTCISIYRKEGIL